MERIVKSFNNSKGFGFLTQIGGGMEAFVTRSSLPAEISTLKEGQRVDFDVKESKRGYEAINVRLSE